MPDMMPDASLCRYNLLLFKLQLLECISFTMMDVHQSSLKSMTLYQYDMSTVIKCPKI